MRTECTPVRVVRDSLAIQDTMYHILMELTECAAHYSITYTLPAIVSILNLPAMIWKDKPIMSYWTDNRALSRTCNFTC